MWRLPCFRRNILPEPVTLKRLATAFRVLAFPAARAMGRGGYPPTVGFQGILRFFVDLKEIALRQAAKAYQESAMRGPYRLCGWRISPPIWWFSWI